MHSIDEEEKEEGEQEAIVRILSGIKFYDIHSIMGLVTVCTYRAREQVAEIFKDDKFMRIIDVTDPDAIMDAFNENGIFCVELHNVYKNLKSLAEDLVVSRISGMMEKEI